MAHRSGQALTALANENIDGGSHNHAEEERAHSVVAALRAKRKREAKRHKEVLGRIHISKPLPMPNRGIQRSLKLQ
jgi:hypothetical protein